jgi:primosomal replication protein N
MPFKGVFTLHLMLEFQVVQSENSHARHKHTELPKKVKGFNEFLVIFTKNSG